MSSDAPEHTTVAKAEIPATNKGITPNDIRKHVAILASEEMEGRMTGAPGGRMATEYLADVFEQLGLEPAGDDDTYFQPFEFTAGISLGDNNKLEFSGADAPTAVGNDWQPLAFSASESFDAAEVVFAGFGLVAPEDGDHPEYDSYVHLDVEGKWVMFLRYVPDDITPEYRQHLMRFAGLRYKAMAARERGAAGIIAVSGPNSGVENELIKLAFDVSLGGTSVGGISVTDEVATALLATADKDLQELHDDLDTGEMMMGFALEGVTLAASIDLVKERRIGRNVLASIKGADPALPAVVVGAHLDHLGRGHNSSSLATNSDDSEIHYGADDNASGVAGLIEIAEYLLAEMEDGRLEPKRDIIFAGWMGEELGLLGSDHYVKKLANSIHNAEDISSKVGAYLNMDMIGRLDKALVIDGAGSSDYWRGAIERRNAPIGLPLKVQDDTYLPTDATSFYLKGVPILSAFSGAHEDYHTPADTPDKLNYEGTAKTARLFALLTRGLALDDEAPEYIAVEEPESRGTGGMRAYLGTVPDYADTDIKGLRLSGVTAGAPADDAGLKGGDIIVELAGKTIENIYDYTYAIQALKVDETVSIVVVRGSERLELEITPRSRE